jgi:RHS repeat-associated protein
MPSLEDLLKRAIMGRSTNGSLCRLVVGLVVLCVLFTPGMALASPPTTAIRYFYDAEGHLKGLYVPSSETALYTWDAAGNLLSVGRKSSLVLSITELAPSEAAVGETVTIDGTGFSTTTSNDTVKFNGTTATVSAATAWALTVKVPTGATTGTVTVQTTTEGPVTSAQTFTVAASPAPHVTSLSASVAAAGSSVTISGSNFESAHTLNNSVAVNGVRAAVTSATSTSLHVTVPGVTLGGHTTVTTPFGSVTGPDLYIPPEGLAASKVGAMGRFTVGGASTTLNLTTGEKIGLGIFDGTAGERVSLTATEYTIGNSEITVWSPLGTLLHGITLFAGEEGMIEPFVLPSTGTYTVMVKPYGADTGKAKLSAYAIHEATESLTPTSEGTAKLVSIGTPGLNARYTVEVSANEVVSIVTSESNLGNVPFEWLNSAGEVVAMDESAGEGEFVGATRFPTAGRYTLVVNPGGATTGSLKFTAYNASDLAGSLTTGEAKTFTISPPGQIAKITFSANSGERIAMQISEDAFNGGIELYNPEGHRISGAGFSGGEFVEPVAISATGTYTIVVTPTDGKTGSFKLETYSVHEVEGSLAPTTEGAQRHVMIETPGQNARYTVEVSANEVVSLATSESNFNTPVEWLNSAGEVVSRGEESGGSGEYLGATRFSAAGTYTLVVNPQGATTGSMTVTAYNASDVTGTITAGGESVVATTHVPGQVAKIAFTGTEGQLLTLKATESTFREGWFSVWGPAGEKLSGSEMNLSGEPRYEFTPSATGTYTVLITGWLADTGSVKLTLYTGSHDSIIHFAGKPAAPDTRSAAAKTPMSHTTGQVGLPEDQLADWPSEDSVDVAKTTVRSARPALHRTAPSTSMARARGGAGALGAHVSRSAVRVPVVARAMPALAVTAQMRAFRPSRSSSSSEATGPGSWRELPGTPWSSIAPLRAAPGVTALSGQALALDGLPLQDVRVAVEDTDIASESDSTGRFLLSGLPAGHHVVVIDGETVPGHERYGVYEVGVSLAAGRTTTLEQTVWLTPLDKAGDRRVGSPTKRETVLTTPQIPGLEVRIPAGTTITNDDGQHVRNLNLTAIPVERPPFALPPFVDVPTYFTVQPGQAYLSKAARIIYPNYTHLPAGERVAFWNYDPDSHGWYVYGHGSVSANGKQIVPDPGVGVWEFSGAMIGDSPSPPATGPKGTSAGGDPVDLYTGLFDYHKTDLVLPDTIPIVIQRSYRQADSNPYSFGVGSTNLYDLRLWSENNYHEADLVLPEGGRVHFVRISPGEGYLEAEYKSTSTPGPYYGATLKWNATGSYWEVTLTDGLTFEFGDLAPLDGIRDRFGDELKISRTEGQRGNITQITSPHGRWVMFTYDGSNRITEIKDDAGQVLSYHYNSNGYLEKATDAASRETKYEYDSSGDMTTITNGRGIKYLENKYNSNDRVSKQIEANSATYEFSYALNGEGKAESTTVTDPRENKQKVAFNSEGYSTSETLGLGSPQEATTQIERQTGTGLILSMTDPLSRKTAYEYDSYGNVTKLTKLAGTSSPQTYKYTYEPGTDELTKETDPLNHSTSYEYGPKGELLTVTDPLSHKTTYEYNTSGQPTLMKNGLGKNWTFGYTLGDLTSVTDPLSRVTKQDVDSLGRTMSVTQPGGQRTVYEYGADNEPTKITAPGGAVTSMEYDNDGNMTSISDPRHNKAVYKYTSMDLPESITDPLEHTETAVYDKNGNITESTNRDGKVNKYTYDALNRMTEAKIGVSGETAERTITYEYDKGNRLKKIVDSKTGTYTPEYDELNRLKSLATPNGTVSYEYDEANRRKSMTVPGQEALKYTYNEANLLTELKRGTQKVTFAYDAGNRLTKTTLIDGIEETYGYDNDNELTSIIDKHSSTTLGELDYAYEPDGRKEALWGSYARTGLPEAFSSASYNADNEQTERGTKHLGYDNEGNLTSDGTNEYKWNALGQLTEITGGTTASFTYDPFGRRISKTIGGTTTKTLYDGINPVQETQGTSTTNLFTSLNPDTILARTTSTATQSFLTEALGSTLALANSSASVETSYTYDPFGATTTEGTSNPNPYQYTGLENDSDGLYNARARYYSPAGARFTSQDPASIQGSGPNLYPYTNDDPINAIDPTGTTLQPPMPNPGANPGPVTGTVAGPDTNVGGGNSGNFNAGDHAGGFGPSPVTPCNTGPIAKGPGDTGGAGVFQAVRCRNFGRLRKAEEEISREEGEEGGHQSPCTGGGPYTLATIGAVSPSGACGGGEEPPSNAPPVPTVWPPIEPPPLPSEPIRITLPSLNINPVPEPGY